MSINSGMGHAGIVAIPIPPDGATSEVLTKQSPADYDMDWDPAAAAGPTVDPGTIDDTILRWNSATPAWEEFTAYILPLTDGLDGQAILTDGAGTLSFGTVSSGGLLSGQYRFSSSIVAADPGPGRFRYDTGSYGTVTQIFIDDFTNQGVDVSNLLASIVAGDRIYIQAEDDSDEFAVWNVTGNTDNTGWFTIDVDLELGGNFLTNNDRVLFMLQIGGAATSFDWVEFVAQSANPGSVAANTLYQDDGSNFDADTVVMGDLSIPMMLTGNVGFDNPGTEQGGINVGGVNYDATVKINGVGGALDALFILHRHSTTIPPIMTFARTNDDTIAHTAVTAGQTLGSLIYTGWSGTHYDIAGVIDVRVPVATTVSPTSLAAEMVFFTVPDGSNTAAIAMLIGSDQIIYGDDVAGGVLELQGAAHSAPDTGIVRLNSPVNMTYDTFSNTTPAQQFAVTWNPATAASGAYIGGYLSTAAVFSITTGVFIPAIFSDTNRYNVGAAPGFSAITFINELSVVANSGNFALPSALVVNVGLTHERNTSGTSTTPGPTGFSFSPQTRATVSGAVLTKTAQTALRSSVTFSTVSGSTANLGFVRGLHMFNPAGALFQPVAGVETMTGLVGVDMNSIPFGGNVLKAAVRSAHVSTGSLSFFLQNTGNCISDFGGSNIHFNTLFGPNFGGTLAAPDLNIGTLGGGVFFFNWTTGDTGQLRISSEVPGNTTDRFLFLSTVSAEYTFDCDRFSLGGQTGSNGNQVGNFVAPTRTVSIGGDWSDFLLTQAGNITVDAAMGTLAAWTINAPSITLGTGSVTTGVALNVGGNPNQGTNRIGVRIISNPTGGGGVNAALWVTAGRSQFDGFVDINQPIALGGGAVATLGTIGGAGPTAAAQAQWAEIEIAGVRHWIAAWT